MNRRVIGGTLAALMLGWMVVSFYLGRYDTRTIQAGTGAKMEFVIQADPLGKLEERLGTSIEVIKIVRIGVTVAPRETVWFETKYPVFTYKGGKPELSDDGKGTLYTMVGAGADSTAIFVNYSEKGIGIHLEDAAGNELSLHKPWGGRGR